MKNSPTPGLFEIGTSKQPIVMPYGLTVNCLGVFHSISYEMIYYPFKQITFIKIQAMSGSIGIPVDLTSAFHLSQYLFQRSLVGSNKRG